MLEFNAERFNRIMRFVTQMRGYFSPLSFGESDVPVNLSELAQEPMHELLTDVDNVITDMDQMGLRASSSSLQRLKAYLMVLSKAYEEHPDGQINRKQPIELSRDVLRSVQDELEGEFFLHLSLSEAGLYSPSHPLMGETVDKQFPSIIYDIKEAGKCLGLQRSTAAAFHSIRCLEAGIFAISRCLSIPDPITGSGRSWMKMLSNIKEEIDRRWPNSGNRMSGDGKIFDEFYGNLSGIQNPYRNSTMHLDKIYTLGEANMIFEIVKGLLSKISSRMNENGDPKA